MLLLDARVDPKLRAFLEEVKGALRTITDERQRAKRLAQIVADRLGRAVQVDIIIKTRVESASDVSA